MRERRGPAPWARDGRRGDAGNPVPGGHCERQALLVPNATRHMSPTRSPLSMHFCRAARPRSVCPPALDTHAVSMWSEPRVHQAAADEPPQKPSFADLSLPAPRPPNRTTRHNHVVILNNQETCRLRVSVAISKRVLMEIYMQPFAGAVSAGVGSVRCSCMTTPPLSPFSNCPCQWCRPPPARIHGPPCRHLDTRPHPCVCCCCVSCRPLTCADNRIDRECS